MSAAGIKKFGRNVFLVGFYIVEAAKLVLAALTLWHITNIVRFCISRIEYGSLFHIVITNTLFVSTIAFSCLVAIPLALYIACWFRPLNPSQRYGYRRFGLLQLVSYFYTRKIMSISKEDIKEELSKVTTFSSIHLVVEITRKIYFRVWFYSFGLSYILYVCFNATKAANEGELRDYLLFLLFGLRFNEQADFMSLISVIILSVTILVGISTILEVWTYLLQLGKTKFPEGSIERERMKRQVKDSAMGFNKILLKSSVTNYLLDFLYKALKLRGIRTDIKDLLEDRLYLYEGKRVVIDYDDHEED